MNKIKLLFFLTTAVLFSGCLKEMKEKEITISVKEEDPIKILQSLTGDAQKTEVMILGSPHLKSLRTNIDSGLFDSLLLALEKFAPDQIGIQRLNPDQIMFLSGIAGKKGNLIMMDDINLEAGLGKIAQKILRTDFASASVIADSLSGQLNSAKQGEVNQLRRKLILYLVATYNIYSASLQWSYLPEKERSKANDIPAVIKDELNRILESPDELNMIGIDLARKLNLQSLIPIDDQQDKNIYSRIIPVLTEEIINDSIYIRAVNSDVYRKTNDIFKEAYRNRNLLPYYVFINSQEYAIEDAEAQWGVFYKLNLESGLDRTRAALWEVRNLNIASNIRRSTSLSPGSKLLVIVDPSHKPFLEAYLSSLGDIKIIQLGSLIQ